MAKRFKGTLKSNGDGNYTFGYTILNVTGSGVLIGVQVFNTSTSGVTKIQVTIDGQVVSTTSTGYTAQALHGCFIPINKAFNSSCLVKSDFSSRAIYQLI